ncbi:MAG: DUF4832 domain-containing protein [Gammaproteobacteria bacterium]|nr:DUF4832 domain-containing protein [Gammaproteobacteria bacterium]
MNPERGLYVSVDLLDESDNYATVRGRQSTLAYAGVTLAAFRDTTLPQAFLDKLDSGFQRAREAGIKIILRFKYTTQTDGEDAPLERIKAHVAQLAPILRKNADVITVMQAGFIGAWGEWHASSNGLDTPPNRRAVLDELLAALPADRAVQVRTPMYKAEYLASDTPLSGELAFSSAAAARLGHHNDCLLGNESDMGTYAPPIPAWRDYVYQEGKFLPVGGETCRVNPPGTNCPAATEALEKAHWSFLNTLYHTDVIAAWKNQGCFSDIERRLGYRIQLLEAAWTANVKPGETLRATLTLQNRGYAAMYNPRPVYLVLQNASFRHEFITRIDPRRWEAGKTLTENLDIKLNAGIAPGTYDVYLWLPDADTRLRTKAEYAVRMANAGMWQPATGMNQLSGQGALLVVEL